MWYKLRLLLSTNYREKQHPLTDEIKAELSLIEHEFCPMGEAMVDYEYHLRTGRSLMHDSMVSSFLWAMIILAVIIPVVLWFCK